MLLQLVVPEGQTVNKKYYQKVIRQDLIHAVRKKRSTDDVEQSHFPSGQCTEPSCWRHIDDHWLPEIWKTGSSRLQPGLSCHGFCGLSRIYADDVSTLCITFNGGTNIIETVWTGLVLYHICNLDEPAKEMHRVRLGVFRKDVTFVTLVTLFWRCKLLREVFTLWVQMIDICTMFSIIKWIFVNVLRTVSHYTCVY